MWRQIQLYQGMRHRALSDFNSQSVLRIGELLYQAEQNIALELKLMRGKYRFNLEQNQVKYTPPPNIIRDWIPKKSIKYLNGTTKTHLSWLTEQEVFEKYDDLENIPVADKPLYWSYLKAENKILILPPVATTDSILTSKINCDSITDWSSDDHIVGIDTENKKEGTGSITITIDRSSQSAAPIAKNDLTSIKLGEWFGVGLWFRSSQYIPSGNIGIGVYDQTGTKYIWVHNIDFDILPDQWHWVQTEILGNETGTHFCILDFNEWIKYHGGGATNLILWVDNICEVQSSKSSIIIDDYIRYPRKPLNYFSSVLYPTITIATTKGSNRMVFSASYAGKISVGDFIGICTDQYGRECPDDNNMYRIVYLDTLNTIVVDRPYLPTSVLTGKFICASPSEMRLNHPGTGMAIINYALYLDTLGRDDLRVENKNYYSVYQQSLGSLWTDIKWHPSDDRRITKQFPEELLPERNQ